jgi:DNA-binding transcriptional LysR family regulator
MNLMDVFAKVVEHESLLRASKILNISQPALSRKIMKLEQELGIPLFDRKGKRLELTKAGQIYYEHVLELHNLERNLLLELQNYRGDKKNQTIKIGASLTTLQATLPDLITWFLKDHPATDIKALTGKTHEVVTMVKDRKVDVGLVASIVTVSGICCDPLFDDHLVLVLPQSHPFHQRVPLSIHDLHHLPMILFSKGTWYRILMDELFQKYAVFPEVHMEIDSFEAIIRLVSTCQIATLLPKSYLRTDLLFNNDLVLRNIYELEQTKRTTSLIYSENAFNQPLLAAFIQKTKQLFSSLSEKL